MKLIDIDRFERFSLAIFEISHYWHKITAGEMEPFGLKGPYAIYFTVLYRCRDGLTAARLGEVCNRDKSDVSRAIVAMSEHGFVEKQNGNNGYRALIRLTESGYELAERINQKVRQAVLAAGRGMTEDERENFYRSLELILGNIKKISEEGLK